MAQWLEPRTLDRKVAGSSPGRSGGIMCFFPGYTFCADSYFGIRSTSVLPQWQINDSGHSAKSGMFDWPVAFTEARL